MINQIYNNRSIAIPKCIHSIVPKSLNGRIICVATFVFAVAALAFYYATPGPQRNQFELDLEQWAKQEGGEASETAKRILDCYKNRSKLLSIANRQLKSLPERLGELKDLTFLSVARNQLKSLPDWLGQLESLKHLLARDNPRLESLPENLSKLTGLRLIDLQNNTSLTHIPEDWFKLSNSCHINLAGVGLSERYISHLKQITSEEGYDGPSFNFSIGSSRIGDVRTLDELLSELYDVAKCEQPESLLSRASESEKGHLRDWLARLSDTYEYRTGGVDKKVGLAKKITEYLELANDDDAFYDAFISLIEGETQTCGDRIALSIIRLGVLKRLVEVDLSNMKELAELLKKGVWTIGLPAGNSPVMGLLERCASEKMETMKLYDDVEVILAYPVKLKESLDLPVDIEDMLFYRFSYVTDVDVDAAKDYVQMMWDNQEEFHNFLISQTKWLDALKQNYSDEFSLDNLLQLTEKALCGSSTISITSK